MSNKKIDFKHDLGIYFNLLKKYIALFILILIISFILEASYTFTKFLFKLVIDDSYGFINNSILKDAYVGKLLKITVIFVIIVAGRSVVRWFDVHLIIAFSARMIIDLKNKFFSHLLYLSHDFHTKHKSGSLISRLQRGGKAVDLMTDIIVFQFSPLAFQIITVGSSIMLFSWKSAISVIITIIAFIVFSFFIQNIQQEYNLKANNAEDFEKGLVSDVFTNIDTIKYYSKERLIQEKFQKAAKRSMITQIKHWSFFRWWDAGHNIILGAGTFFTIFFAVFDLINKKIEVGTLVFIFTAYMDIITPLFLFVFGMRNFYRSMADFDSLFQYAKIKNDIVDKPDALNFKIKKGIVEFRDVSFKYHKKNLFNNFNLVIHENEKVALVGYSGCGKTTLIKLLYRFYDVDKGAILLDGINIKDIKKESLRSEMAIVPQDCILFDDTVYNNIIFAKPDAGKDEINKAIKLSQLNDIIDNFPDKEHTVVGERGVRLSGGEKQRISIARALIADKKIIVLDEATSSLDSKTEYDIQKDLEKLLKGRTAIIIAHRLSTIMNADRVIVMDKGRIVQMGAHNELIMQDGVYKKLWELQKNGYIE